MCEVLRYFSVVPMGFPRVCTAPITVCGATVPKGSWFFMNCRTANHDPAQFEQPARFEPERYLHVSTTAGGPNQGHFSYGAGARACVGYHLANRLMYVMFGRLVLRWTIYGARNADTDPNTYNMCPSSLVAEPRDFS